MGLNHVTFLLGLTIFFHTHSYQTELISNTNNRSFQQNDSLFRTLIPRIICLLVPMFLVVINVIFWSSYWMKLEELCSKIPWINIPEASAIQSWKYVVDIISCIERTYDLEVRVVWGGKYFVDVLSYFRRSVVNFVLNEFGSILSIISNVTNDHFWSNCCTRLKSLLGLMFWDIRISLVVQENSVMNWRHTEKGGDIKMTPRLYRKQYVWVDGSGREGNNGAGVRFSAIYRQSG